jgi:hypothetical protein
VSTTASRLPAVAPRAAVQIRETQTKLHLLQLPQAKREVDAVGAMLRLSSECTNGSCLGERSHA